LVREALRTFMQRIFEIARHDPAAIVGFLLFGAGGFLFIYVEFKMLRAGHETSRSLLARWNRWPVLVKYLKVRAEHGWSPWPVYLIAPCFVLGLACLVYGLFHL